jgi:hypothetical protein
VSLTSARWGGVDRVVFKFRSKRLVHQDQLKKKKEKKKKRLAMPTMMASVPIDMITVENYGDKRGKQKGRLKTTKITFKNNI